MATLVQTKTFGGDNQGSVNPIVSLFVSTPIVGNKIALEILSFSVEPTSIIIGGTTVNPTTTGGVAMTKGPHVTLGSGDCVSIWWCDVTSAVVTKEIAIKMSAGVFTNGAACEFSGMASGAPEAISNTATGSSNAPAVSTTGAITSPAGTLFAAWANGTNGNHNAAGTPVGWTQMAGVTGSEGGDGSRKSLSGASGTQSVTFSVNGGGSISWAAAIMYIADIGATTSVSFSGLTVQVA